MFRSVTFSYVAFSCKLDVRATVIYRLVESNKHYDTYFCYCHVPRGRLQKEKNNNTSFCDKTTRIPVVLNKLTNSDRMCKSRSRDLIVFSVGWFLWLCMLLVSRHSSRQAWKMSCNLRSFSITWLGFLSWKYCFCLLGALQCLKVMSFVLCYSSWLLRYISLASSVASF